jgi:hypothetical protein
MSKCNQCGKHYTANGSKFCSKPCSDLHVLNYKDTVTIQGKLNAGSRESYLEHVIKRSEAARQAAVRKNKLKADRDQWYIDTISKCEWRNQRDKDKIKLVKYQQNNKCFKCKKESFTNPLYLDGDSKNTDRQNIVCICSNCKRDMKTEIHFNVKADRIAKRAAKKAENSKQSDR